jgi:hypothetical protein
MPFTFLSAAPTPTTPTIPTTITTAAPTSTSTTLINGTNNLGAGLRLYGVCGAELVVAPSSCSSASIRGQPSVLLLRESTCCQDGSGPCCDEW